MAEERILIDILPPASGFGSCGGFYTEGVGEYFCCWNGEKERVTEVICNNCPHDKSMTRQEAIKKIETHLNASTIKFSTTPDVVAEIALNALLEGK